MIIKSSVIVDRGNNIFSFLRVQYGTPISSNTQNDPKNIRFGHFPICFLGMEPPSQDRSMVNMAQSCRKISVYRGKKLSYPQQFGHPPIHQRRHGNPWRLKNMIHKFWIVHIYANWFAEGFVSKLWTPGIFWLRHLDAAGRPLSGWILKLQRCHSEAAWWL